MARRLFGGRLFKLGDTRELANEIAVFLPKVGAPETKVEEVGDLTRRLEEKRKRASVILWIVDEEPAVSEPPVALAKEGEGPATYYKVSLYAPYMYGLVQMVLIGLFPVAALWALWPGHWKVLLNFGKLFLSVKLWTVFWSILAAFNQARHELVLGNDPARNGIGNQIEILPSIVAMYLLTPVLSYMIVSLATTCGSLAFNSLMPSVKPIGGVQDLHKEAKEYQTDVNGMVNGARAGTQEVMGGGPSRLLKNPSPGATRNMVHRVHERE